MKLKLALTTSTHHQNNKSLFNLLLKVQLKLKNSFKNRLSLWKSKQLKNRLRFKKKREYNKKVQKDKQEHEKNNGDWIPTNYREDFIKQYRLKNNLEIKFTKGYDLYKARLENWVSATPEMKENYEEMKKHAQVEEYKFMEKVMNQFDYKQKET